MRGIGSLHPTEGIILPADCVASVIGTTAGVIVAMDWPSSTGPLRPDIASFAASVPFYLNEGSTKAAIPTTNTTGTTLSSDRNVFVNQEAIYQIPGGSTGFSVAFPSSGILTIEFFKKGGGS